MRRSVEPYGVRAASVNAETAACGKSRRAGAVAEGRRPWVVRERRSTLPRTITLTATEHDDPAFVELVGRVMNGAIQVYRPVEVYIIQIDTWFDHKWNHYSGRLGYCRNAWLDPLRPPPFTPNRVKSQLAFQLSKAEPFEFDRKKAPALHIEQSSPNASHRRLIKMTSSGLYVWYSGETAKVDRASLMVYSIQNGQNIGWYVSLLKRGEWKIGASKGISNAEFLDLVRRASESNATEPNQPPPMLPGS